MRLHPHDRRDLSHGASVASSVQPVEHTLGAPLGEQGRELTARETADAFSREFDLMLQRIRNQHVVDSARLSHTADGVLQAPSTSPKNDSESLSERAAR